MKLFSSVTSTVIPHDTTPGNQPTAPIVHKYYVEMTQYPNGMIAMTKWAPVGKTARNWKSTKKKTAKKAAPKIVVKKTVTDLAVIQSVEAEEY